MQKLKDDVSSTPVKSSDLFGRSLKKKEKHINKTSEVKFHLQQQTAEIINSTQRRLHQLQDQQLIKESQIEDYTKKINQIDFDLRTLKVRVNNRMTEHKKYYFEILKQGIDVRQEGLTWVLQKLIELKAFIENSKFPKFLNSQQIDYLLTISYKKHELSELIKLFQVLKNKQKTLKDQFNQTHRVDDYSKGNYMQIKTTLETEGNEFRIERTKEENAIPQQYISNFELIAQKYESVINVCLNENKEGKYVGGIVKDLRKKIIRLKIKMISIVFISFLGLSLSFLMKIKNSESTSMILLY